MIPTKDFNPVTAMVALESSEMRPMANIHKAREDAKGRQELNYLRAHYLEVSQYLSEIKAQIDTAAAMCEDAPTISSVDKDQEAVKAKNTKIDVGVSPDVKRPKIDKDVDESPDGKRPKIDLDVEESPDGKRKKIDMEALMSSAQS